MAYKYKKLKLPDGSTMDEHRWLWIQSNGPIPKGMVVHHRNDNPRDNRLDNLELMTRADHSRHHALESEIATRMHTPEAIAASAKSRTIVEPEGTAWCNRCKEFLPVARFTINRSRPNGLAKQCALCRSESRRK